MTAEKVHIDPEARIESREFRMNSGRFAMEMVYRYAAPWLLTLLACAVAGIVLGITVDLRWLVVGLMAVFVVEPMLLAFLYYYLGLRREAFVNTFPHVIATGRDGVVVRLNLGEDTEPREEFFPYSEMSPVRTGLQSASIPLGKAAKGFLWIPVSAFENDNLFIEAIQTIDYCIHRANGIPLPFDAVTADCGTED